MKLVIQRVQHASVRVEGREIGSVGLGFMVLVGIGKEDNEESCRKLARKMLGLRIFPDAEGKTNLALEDVNGGLLLISQFTLYADCKHGFRPSFINAAPPEEAGRLYEYFVGLCRESGLPVGTGSFGAHMEVELLNDGPFTIILEE